MLSVTFSDIREKYLRFFAERDHIRIPSASLVPENDATTLFTGSGMQPLLPYLLGQPHPQGKRLVDSQKSFRAEDIEEVGDNRHTTFFEMLGNWSFGDYFKAQQLPWLFEFLTVTVRLDPTKLYVTVFSGDEAAGIPRDTEAATTWQRLFTDRGIKATLIDIITVANGGERGMQDGRIFFYDSSKNWWSRSGVPAGMPAGEPGGPDSEMFYDFGTPHDPKFGAHCHPNCDCGRFMEIGNSVFMEYLKQTDGSFAPLPNKNVDFGGGLERITAAANNQPDVFSVGTLREIIAALEQVNPANKPIPAYGIDPQTDRSFRIIADHLRAAVMVMSDGVEPSSNDRGYIVRRLLRRAAHHKNKLELGDFSLATVVPVVVAAYEDAYPALAKQASRISTLVTQEEERFSAALLKGTRKITQILQNRTDINGPQAFELYATYGLPIDVITEIAAEHGATIDMTAFQQLMAEHREKSRTAAAGKFKGGLADHSDMSVKYHTATHLLHQALRTILGDHVVQKGSNITPERLRFDFSHPDKLTDEQKKAVENLVNEQITKDLPVTREEMTVADGKKRGALGLFADKYADRVSVYSVGDFSVEICGGPHVEHTGVLGTFRITKEESASAGIRRIKAVLE